MKILGLYLYAVATVWAMTTTWLATRIHRRLRNRRRHNLARWLAFHSAVE